MQQFQCVDTFFCRLTFAQIFGAFFDSSQLGDERVLAYTQGMRPVYESQVGCINVPSAKKDGHAPC